MKNRKDVKTSVVWLASLMLAVNCAGDELPDVMPPNPARVAEIAAHLPEKPGVAILPDAPNLNYALSVLSTPIPDCSDELYLLTTTTGNRMKYQKVYFEKQTHLRTMARMARLSSDERFLKRAIELLESICAERSWVLPAHDRKLENFHGTKLTIDLGSSDRAHTVANTLALLGDKLPADLRKRAMDEVERRVFAPYRATNADSGDVAAFRSHGNWWFFVRNNWSAVCHNYVCCAALAVIQDRSDRAAFVEAAERGMRYFLASFLEDGYCTEGIGYWNYGFGHFLELARIVRATTGGFLDFTRMPRAKEAMAYAFNFRLDKTHYPAFADGASDKIESWYFDLGCSFWPEFKSVRKGKLPPRTYFAAPQVYIGRTPHLAFSMKGGNNGELHNHNDLGSWTLVVDGKVLAGDPGAEIYTARTFSKDRYVSKVLNSYGHPVPRVNGELQLVGKTICAEVVKREFSDSLDIFSLDLSSAYPSTRGKGRALVRAVAVDRKNESLTIADRLQVESPIAFESALTTYESACPLVPSATGGAWHLETEDIENPGRPTVHRYAVVFDAPVSNATIVWRYAVQPTVTRLPETAPTIRQGHPRIFFNADTWPLIKAAAEGPAKNYRDALISRCDRYPENPVCLHTEPAPEGHSSATPLQEVREWGLEASECALAYRFTGERKYLDKSKRMLTVSIAAYHEAYRNRRAVSWYGRKRILALCAYDWLYEALTDDERRAIIVPLVQHVEDVQWGPDKPKIVRHNGHPTGYKTGHYGTDGILWYSGLATIGDGYCDELAQKHLETGYGYLCKHLAFRQDGARDDGPLTTGTLGYTTGEYPWSQFNYFHSLRSAAGIDATGLYPGLALFPNYVWWNWINSEKMPLLFGSGDTRHCQNHINTEMLGEHLMQYAYFYAKSAPDASRLAATLARHIPEKARLDLFWPVYPYLLASVDSVEPFDESELQRRAPRARHFETTGQIVMRSGWKPDSTYAMFTSGGIFENHRHFDENGFIIYKKGYLALDSGTRAYQDDYNLAYYYSQTVAHNCVLIHREGETMPYHWGLRYDGPEGKINDGGQTVYNAAKVIGFETNPLFTYIAGDATAAYPGKCRECVRQFLYVTDDCFVIYDRVTSDRAEYAKEWLLHTENEPTVKDGLLTTTANGGTLFCRTLLPEKAIQEKIGGSGKEFWSNGKNWEVNPKYLADSAKKCAEMPGTGPWFGKWRLSVKPPKAAIEDRFLHVINVSGDADAKPCVSCLEREGKRDVAVFRVQGVTVKGKTGTLEVRTAFNREGAVGGEISYRLLNEADAVIFSGRRVLTNSVQPQSGVFAR